MALYSFRCEHCDLDFDESHPMRAIPEHASCPSCGARADRQFVTPNFNTRGDDVSDNGKPQYMPGLARKMPFGREDPAAYYTSKYKAREAARRKADTGDYQLTFD